MSRNNPNHHLHPSHLRHPATKCTHLLNRTAMPTSTPRKRPRTARARQSGSIVDLLGGTTRADTALGNDAPDDAWTSLAHTVDNLVTRSLPPRDSLSVPSITQKQSTQALARGHTEVSGIPPDRTLKTSIKITTTNSLAWTKFKGQGEEYAALAAYVAGVSPKGPVIGSDAAASPDESVTVAKRQFYKGLLHFRHPLDPGALAARWQTGTAGRDADVTRRIEAWQASLQSLFYGYKHALVQEFYVLLPSTVVLFTRTPHPVVWFARGTPGVRSLLSEYCVDFRVRGDDEDPGVVVDGNDNVQAAYSFVFSAGPRLSGAADVPLLVADKPFRGGTVVSAEIGVVNEMSVVGEDGSRYSVIISGLLLPRQTSDISEALKVVQKTFQATVDTERRSTRLNICETKDENGVANGEAYSSRQIGVITRIAANEGELRSVTKDFD